MEVSTRRELYLGLDADCPSFLHLSVGSLKGLYKGIDIVSHVFPQAPYKIKVCFLSFVTSCFG